MTRKNLPLFILLGWLSAFAPLSMDMYLPALPAVGTEFGVGAADVQLTLTACLVGLALGQLVAGPASDRWGRKKPLLVGLVSYTVVSLLCAVTTDITVLTGLRLVQGLAGAAGIVISRAVVRDLYSGDTAARVLSTLMLINGLAPILAPLIGGELLRFGTWRLAFWVLSGVGAILLLATGWFKDTLPANLKGHSPSFLPLLRDRVFVGRTLTGALAFAALFGYISASPFVLQNVFALTPQQFSYAFAANALVLVAAGQLNGLLLRRWTPTRMLRIGLAAMFAGGVFLLIAVLTHLGLPGVLPALMLVVSSMGLIFPNNMALALADHGNAAGTASALLGTTQFLVGATVVPLVGLAGDHTALPMALVVATLSAGAIAAYTLTLKPQPTLATAS